MIEKLKGLLSRFYPSRKQEEPPPSREIRGTSTIPSSKGLAFFTTSLDASSLRFLYKESSVVRDCVDSIAATIAGLPYQLIFPDKSKIPEIRKQVFESTAPTGETFYDVLVAAVSDLLAVSYTHLTLPTN